MPTMLKIKAKIITAIVVLVIPPPITMPIIAVYHKAADWDSPLICLPSNTQIKPAPIKPNAEITCAAKRAGSLCHGIWVNLKNSTEIIVTNEAPTHIRANTREVFLSLKIRPMAKPTIAEISKRIMIEVMIIVYYSWVLLW